MVQSYRTIHTSKGIAKTKWIADQDFKNFNLLDKKSCERVNVKIKTRKNAIVEYLDYQIPVTQLMGPKGNGDMHAAKRD